MAEKKIVTLGIRMPESMLLSLKGIAEAKGQNESELVRMLISELVEREREYFRSLHSIFADASGNIKEKPVTQCSTVSALSDSE